LKKDYFHSCLQDRLQYAQEFAKDYVIYLKSVEFTKKTESEFYKNNRLLFLLNKILNLPTNTLKLIKVLKSKFILKKCLIEIEVIKKELKNYE
tara:strand:+ start:2116 stop:2394 length:279 start_codon:yes stop_codon:yes gene_type:complete